MSSLYNSGPRIALNRNTGSGGPGTPGNVSFVVEEINHGYTTADLPLAMYHTSTGWQEAQSNLESTLATHVMVEIVNANRYILAQAGRYEIVGHGLTVDNYYFVSDVTAGHFIPGEPTEFSNPLLFIESVDYIHVLPFRPSLMNEDIITNVSSFLDLTDTPNSYAGQAAKIVSVKSDQTGLEFITNTGGGTFDESTILVETIVIEGYDITSIVVDEDDNIIIGE
jgi:hypothetical protein